MRPLSLGTVLLGACALLLSGCRAESEEPEDPTPAMSKKTHTAAYTNRLAKESSPYLLQHAHNPVDWWPWCDEAFEAARAQNKPIFLSIGYSACHWCHVMAHESFENPDIAAIVNEHFISIKVDREERPDVDTLYMSAVQMMTGGGGWPLTVFLTPDRKPFFGGTYFPPTDRYGRPGFPSLLTRVAEAWKTQRDDIEKSAQQLTDAVQKSAAGTPPGQNLPGLASLEQAMAQWRQTFDRTRGGFGGAPKFPPSGALGVLLRQHARTGEDDLLAMVTTTLDAMARGGMYDQLGGGFHRYSVDAEWLVPHFEKMLYDNALLSRVYLEAYQVTGNPFYRRIATEIFEYVLRDMTDDAGGFHSAEDADSEGEEGLFYIWSEKEIDEALPAEDAEIFKAFYDVTPGGNFEGHSILNVPRPMGQFAESRGLTPAQVDAQLAPSRVALMKIRDCRVRPGLDDKVLADWNGMMISSLAIGYQVLGDARYLAAAERAASFVLGEMMQDDVLLHTYRKGQAKLPAYLDDYAQMANALIDLYESSFDPRWIRAARGLTATMLAQFEDPDGGGLFLTSDQHRHLLARTKPFQDGAIPSGNAVAALLLMRLSALTGEAPYSRVADDIMRGAQPMLDRYPSALSHSLLALDFVLSSPVEIAIIGAADSPGTDALLTAVRRRFLPGKVLALSAAPVKPETATLIPLLAERGQVDGSPTAYVCRNFACQAPVTDAAALGALLGK